MLPIITAIFAGNYSWACILFLHLLDCIPTKYIPPQIYLKLLEDNFIPHISKQNQADKFNK
ncbi:HetP family heterocyst commitment protein [Umezakia ovalisporum]|uniref:HetP family heterocyst commitment protein n=1 Tax=Umezakia ovalisporum TaxID=75695 RepID=UPI0024743CBF|nr:HetP family heterocyst commitment protein [Umezakia ovalisporum]MDH6084958.1 HetP family heterocyst commitment protein [Umezakia ovalisporum TAC611]